MPRALEPVIKLERSRLSRPSEAWWLIGLPLLVGGALRLHNAWSLRAVYVPHLDNEEGYYEAATSLLSHKSLSLVPNWAPSAVRGPIYPTFIALVEGLFEQPSPGRVRLAQAVLFTLAIALVFFLGRRLISPIAGFMAALGMALDPDLILGAGGLNIHPFYSVFILALAAATLLWLEQGSARATVLLGLVLAASLMVRSPHYPFPVLLGLASVLWWRSPARPLRKVLVLAGTTALFLSPLVARNWLHFGRLILLDTHKGSYLFLAGTTGPHNNMGVDEALEIAESIQPGFKKQGLTGAALHDALLGLAVKTIRADPLRYAGYCAKRLRRFWEDLWVPLLLGLLALALNPGNRGLQAAFLLAASFSGYAAAGGAVPHRLAVFPLLYLLGACGAASILRLLGFFRTPREAPEPRPLELRAPVACAAALYAAALGFLAVEIGAHWWPRHRWGVEPTAGWPDRREVEVLRMAAVQGPWGGIPTRMYADALRRHAVRLIQQGEADEADSFLKRAAFLVGADGRRRGEACVDRARLRIRRKDAAGAREHLRLALRLDPGNRDALSLLSQSGLEQGWAGGEGEPGRPRADLAEVEARLRETLRADPPFLESTVLLAVHLWERRRPAEALRLLDRFQDKSRGSGAGLYARWRAARFLARCALGQCPAARGDLEIAIRVDAGEVCSSFLGLVDPRRVDRLYYDLCLRQAPRQARLYSDRGVARFLKGDKAGAAADFRQALSLEPANLEAAMSLATALDGQGRAEEAVGALVGTLARAWWRRGEAIYGRALSLRDELKRRGAGPRAAIPARVRLLLRRRGIDLDRPSN